MMGEGKGSVGETRRTVAVHEVVVGYSRGVFAGVDRVAALEDLGVWPAVQDEGFGFEGVVVELVEVAFEGKVVFGLSVAAKSISAITLMRSRY